jgi:hypothetical protein
MILRTGDMWTDSHADVILVTGNATVNAAGRLVMGRGAALEATVRYPGCAKVFGGELIKHNVYGILVHPTLFNPLLGVFQVKYAWSDPAVPALISSSAERLRFMAETEWADKRIALNFPGIGNERLKQEDVLPLIENLPDNVTVWVKD